MAAVLLLAFGANGLTDADDNWYRVPASLPPVPAGGYVVVVFDGQGSAVHDLSFGDNVATMHQPTGSDWHL